MLVVMENHATQAEIARVVETIEEMGYTARPMPGGTRTSVGLIGNDGRVDGSRIEALPGVAEVIHVSKPYKQVSREWKADNTIVTIAPGVSFGGTDVVIVAGPCSVESEEQIVSAARAVRDAGATALRGGAFKPRSSPYSFQGLGKRGLDLLALAHERLDALQLALDDIQPLLHLPAQIRDHVAHFTPLVASPLRSRGRVAVS
jgi:3-deoxy-7-phosphoheptulonate synthase